MEVYRRVQRNSLVLHLIQKRTCLEGEALKKSKQSGDEEEVVCRSQVSELCQPCICCIFFLSCSLSVCTSMNTKMKIQTFI